MWKYFFKSPDSHYNSFKRKPLNETMPTWEVSSTFILNCSKLESKIYGSYALIQGDMKEKVDWCYRTTVGESSEHDKEIMYGSLALGINQ